MNRKSNIQLLLFVFAVNVIFVGIGSVSRGAASPRWNTSYLTAVRLARQSRKPILTWFTGSDWCTWCKRLEAEVFDTTQFKQWARKNVVLLLLDFPRRKSQSDEIKRQNENLLKKYRVQGFPTVLFITSQAEELGRTGYLSGGPDNWISTAQSIIDENFKPEATVKRLSIVAAGAKIKKLAGGFKFTEGPAADAKGHIFFSDIPNNRIHKWAPEGKPLGGMLSTFSVDSGGSNGLYFDKKGNLLACQGSGRQLVSIDPKGKVTVLADRYKNKRLNKPNDLWLDPKGGIYFTDPFYGQGREAIEQDGEHVYYLSPDRKKLIRVIDDMVRPNGIIGTADGKVLYVTDHGGKKTFVYTINKDGTLSNKKLFAPEGSDGMTIDNQGNIYLTTKVVAVYNKKGERIETIEVPEGPANVTFGGPDKRTLFITARTSLYAVRMRVKGL